MKLEEMKKIAEARTKGEWSDLSPSPYLRYPGNNPTKGPEVFLSDVRFIAMAANNIDKLIAIVEAAKTCTKEARKFAKAMAKIPVSSGPEILENAIKELERK